MPHEIGWRVDGCVIWVRLYGELTATALDIAAADMVAYIRAATTDPIYMLVDVIGLTKIAIEWNELMNAPNLIELIELETFGWIAYYDNINPYMVYMLEMWNHQTGSHAYMFSDEQEAIAFLRSKGAPL